nr:MAG TPA: hypothetical protein [Caudoviricetes sp.]
MVDFTSMLCTFTTHNLSLQAGFLLIFSCLRVIACRESGSLTGLSHSYDAYCEDAPPHPGRLFCLLVR